ncbi:D-3-phosphoglycerate dehydrogenase [Psychrobacillus psychrotolerans]|uniref:D-3-phosphoglycerate dehydrogenase n=1 Tax=Psychrobacillus psychrotolerans TaxID=126156 RepID=A0A1I6ABN5_9BACI|nr:C-terminal binding protein [Psychrobacillus psychrotolerans]SFQ66042.1 D-3-phosphoglycerate dehydrogenase [Psychrobacillus psychrotolerans]
MFKVTLIDHEWEDLLIEESMLSEANVQFTVLQSRDKAEIIQAAQQSDAIIILYANIDREIMEAAPNLKLISRFGIGINMVDVEAATELGIQVANVNDYCVDEVSDHALASIMAAARNLFVYYEDTNAGGWDFKKAQIPLRANKAIVGLLGYGKIPRRLGQKLNAIGYKVKAYDPFISAGKMEEDGVVKATFDEIMISSDFVSIHVPLIKATTHLIGERELKMMKRSAFIINTARGPIIDEKALVIALENDEIAGAFLDVTEEEPLPETHPLRNLKQVVLTPHAAWYSVDAFREIREKAVRNVVEKSEGKSPTYLLN